MLIKTVKITEISLLNSPKNCRQTTNGGLVNFSLVKIYPRKVYHCQCVSLDVKLCLVNGDYSLKDICTKLRQSKVNRLFYCCKVGDGKQDVIFSCLNHMQLTVFYGKHNDGYLHLDQQSKNNCKRCIKKYLQIAYSCCYQHTNFDIPLAIKKEKKVLCLRLTKL